ncbi:MAG: glycosyltransferase family 2 protein [Cyanobacteria bacterium P01_A01_bin.83]
MSNNQRKSPKVSIGIPVYNGEKYLELALDSLIQQSFTDFEIIICDNASTDRTESICRSYQSRDERIFYYRNETNLGAAGNYKKVFQLAQGEFFKWMAHDDRCSPNYLAECVQALEADPEIVMTFPRFELIDESDRTYPIIKKNTYLTPELTITTNPERNFMSSSPSERYGEVLFKTTECYEFFGLARREIIERTSQHDAYYGSDKVLLCELAMMGKIKEVNSATGYFRIHGEQSQSLKSHKERSQWISPNLSYGVFLSRVKCLQGYYHSIFAYSVPLSERIKCFWILTSWTIDLGNWMLMLNEILQFKPKVKQERLGSS